MNEENQMKELAKELCEKSGCHHKCHDTKNCVVEDEAKSIVGEWKFDEKIGAEQCDISDEYIKFIDEDGHECKVVEIDWKSPPSLTLKIELSDEDQKNLIITKGAATIINLGLLFEKGKIINVSEAKMKGGE